MPKQVRHDLFATLNAFQGLKIIQEKTASFRSGFKIIYLGD